MKLFYDVVKAIHNSVTLKYASFNDIIKFVDLPQFFIMTVSMRVEIWF